MKTIKVFMLVIFFSILIFMNLLVFADSGNQLPETDKLEEAALIKSGTYTGNLGEENDKGHRDNDDYYSIELEEGQLIALELSIPGNVNYQVYLLNPNKNSRGSVIAQKESKILDYVADSTGTWYIKIHRSSGEGEYQLAVDIQDQNDADSGQDAGKSVQEAIPLSPGTITGFLKRGDNDDYYSIEVEEGQLITLQLTIPGNANYQIYLLNPNKSSRGSVIAQKESKILDYVADSTGIWYIRIHRSSGEGEYQLSLNISVGQAEEETGTSVRGRDIVKKDDKSTYEQSSTEETLEPQENQPPVASFEFPPIAMAEIDILFDASLSYDLDGKINTYEWEFKENDEVLFTENEERVICHFDTPGTYEVVLYVTDNEGARNTAIYTIEIVPKTDEPVAMFTYVSIGTDEEDYFSFDGSSSYGPRAITVYEWDFGDRRPTEVGEQVNYNFPRPGIYQVTLTVEDEGGEHDKETQTIDTTILPLTASFTISPREAGVSETVNFDASSSHGPRPIETYEWDFGDDSEEGYDSEEGHAIVVKHTFTAPGTYTVQLTIIDDFGVTSTQSDTITILAIDDKSFIQCGTIQAGSGDSIPFRAAFPGLPIVLTSAVVDENNVVVSSISEITNTHFIITINDLQGNSIPSSLVHWIAFVPDPLIRCLGDHVSINLNPHIAFDKAIILEEDETIVVVTNAVKTFNAAYISSVSHVTENGFDLQVLNSEGNSVAGGEAYWMAVVPSDENGFQGGLETLNNGAVVTFDTAFINPPACVCCSSTPGIVAGAVSSSPSQFTLGLSTDAGQAELNWLAYGGAVPSLQPGQIEVSSTPAGAEVYLDGSEIGITPEEGVLEIPNLMPGRYTVKLQLQDYNDYERTVTVSPTETLIIDRDLRLATGTIEVSSDPPGANIWLDGSMQAYWDYNAGKNVPYVTTNEDNPFILENILPGEHTITLSLTNFVTWSGTNSLVADGTWTINETLDPEPGTITVASNPSGATVYLTSTPDDQDSWDEEGVTPIELSVLPGDYTIKCCLDYYEDKLITVTVNSNQTSVEDCINLTRARGCIKIIAKDEQGKLLPGAYLTFDPYPGLGHIQGPTSDEDPTKGTVEGTVDAGYYEELKVWRTNYNSYIKKDFEITDCYTSGAPLEILATLVAKPGSINVTSTPPGATVYLADGDQTSTTGLVNWQEMGETGETSLTITGITRGTYTLKLSLLDHIPHGLSPDIVVPSEGYPFKAVVTVEPGQCSTVEPIPIFTRMTGTIKVTSNKQSATVIIDGDNRGTILNGEGGIYSRLFENISIGTHTVEVTKNGFVSGSMSDTVMVLYNTEVVFNANLYQPQELTAFIYANPLYGNPGLGGLEVNFTGAGAGPEGTIMDGYAWNFGDISAGNDTFSQEQNPTHTYNNVGDYDVSLAVTDGEETSPLKYVCIRVRNQNIVESALDCLTIFYDNSDTSVTGETTYSGNILINGFLKVDDTPGTDTPENVTPGTVTVEDDGEVTVNGNLITDNDAIDNAFAAINNGGSFTIGEKDSDVGGCYRSIGSTFSNFSLYGLGFSVSDLKLYENRLSLSANFTPSWLPARGAEATISVSSEGLKFGGGIELPEFTIAGFGIKGAFLNLDLGCEGGNCWEAGITFELPPVVGITIGGKLGIQNGNLNMVSIKVSGFKPPIPIGNTGVFLESLDGGLENIPPDPDPLVFHAGAGFYAGPEIPPIGNLPPINLLGIDFGEEPYHLLGGNVNLTVDCGGSFTAEGNAYILNDNFGQIGDAGFTILFPRGLRLWGNVKYPPGGLHILDGTLRSKLDLLPDMEFQASVEGSASIPEFIPIIGGYTFGEAVGYIDNDLIATGVSIGNRVCFCGHCVNLSIPVCVKFEFDPPALSVARNWDAIQEVDLTNALQFLQASQMGVPLVYAGLGAPPLGKSPISSKFPLVAQNNPTIEKVFEMPQELEVAIFYMQVTNRDIPPKFTVTTPDGVEFAEGSTEGHWRRNDIAGDLWCAVPDPKAGRWTVTPDDSLRGSEYKIAIYQLNEKPTLNITSPNEDIFVDAGMNIPITWEAEDSDDEAVIRLCYSDSQLQLVKSNLPAWPGNTIVKNLSEENLKSSPYNWNTTGVAPGKYYIYGVITDGKNFPVFAWSEGSVTIQRKDFPPPKGVKAHQKDSIVQVEWDSLSGVTGYRVYYQNVNSDAPLTVAVSQGIWEDMATKAKCLLEEERPSDISEAEWEYMSSKAICLLEEGPMAISQAVWEDTTTELGHLEHGVTYRIAVTAFNAEGMESDYSKFIEVTY